MKTCKEKALEWNVSPRSVNDMCKKGRIQGAIKEKGSWLIPDDSPKPMDGRVSNGKYIKKNMVAKAEVKSLPIGISDYVRAQEEYYYVDKTLLIKEFLDQKPLVSLFTRPRRFGKTLNMDMLRVFFEISDKNTSKYFVDKNIWQCGEEYRSHQGKYPVIFLTFKDVKFDTWDATIDKIRGLLQEEYGRHQELLNSDKLSQYEKMLSYCGYVENEKIAMELFEEYQKQLENSWILFDDVVDMLHSLEGYRLGIISNGKSIQQRAKLSCTNIEKYFEIILISEETGFAKPSVDIFYEAVKQSGEKIDSVIYVGDNIKTDILPCEKIGMKCVLVDRNSICEKNICKIKNLYEIHNVLLNDIGQYNTELSIRSSAQ